MYYSALGLMLQVKLVSEITSADKEKMRKGVSLVPAHEWEKQYEQKGHVVLVTGTDNREYGYTLQRRLADIGKIVLLLDNGVLGIGKGEELAEICKAAAEQGLIVFCISEDISELLQGKLDAARLSRVVAQSKNIYSSVEEMIQKL